MSDNGPEGTAPVVFKTSALGHAVLLGELYDQRSGLFLGVQLWPEENIEVAETDIRNTELSLSLSTTLEDKASLLDISAKLSLEIMSGMVSVSGSASYIKDTKSNTQEQAFALALKMRLNEKRILFAEDKLGRNVLTVASQDYIANKSATHFVSAIVYGGSLIVNLVAKQSKLETDEKLEGQLHAKFEKLTGAISLEGEAKVGISDEFKSMDDKFDLVIHGDVALDKVPVNPQDVLEVIPEGASLIKEGGGVATLVTLQPIPEALITGSLIYEIDRRFVAEVFEAFSRLDDLHSRFAVLVDSTKAFEEFVPELARVSRVVADIYIKDHGTLLHELRDFLYDYQHGNPLGDDWKGDGQNVPVLVKARELYNRHQELDDTSHVASKYYPSTLLGLEKELPKFQFFVSDIQQLRDNVLWLAESTRKFVSLSSLDTVCSALRHQNTLPLFVMTPFTPKQPDIDTSDSSADLNIIKFLAILREKSLYFNNLATPARILYAETLDALTRRLPNLAARLSVLKGPALLIGQVNVQGELSWTDPPEIKQLYSKLYQESSVEKLGDLTYDVHPINGKKSFTIQIRGKASTDSTARSTICSFQTRSKAQFLKFRWDPLGVDIERNYVATVPVDVPNEKQPPEGQKFVATLVQDVEEEEWSLYLDKEKVQYVYFTSTLELLSDSANVQLVFSASSSVAWWNGELLEVRAFSRALTEDEVKEEVDRE